MSNKIFKLNFKSDRTGIVTIDEIIGYYDVELNLDQKPNMLGRDVSFSSGEINFEFSVHRNHYFEKILYYFNRFGFESDVELIVSEFGFDDIVLELDFATADTDELEYFKCNAIQKSSLQIAKRRKSIKVDMFSDKDVDGNHIEPLVPQNMLLLSKPVRQYSTWEQYSDYSDNLFVQRARSEGYYQVNPCSLVKGDVQNSLTFFENRVVRPTDDYSISPFQLVEAKGNLKNVKVNINDTYIKLRTDVYNGGNGYANFRLIIRHGKDFATAKEDVLFSETLKDRKTFEGTISSLYNIASLERGDSIWVFFHVKVRQSAEKLIPFKEPKLDCFTTIKGMKMEVSADSASYNSIVPTFRLIDVVKQIVKSTSGLGINAPRFDVGGQFYDNVLCNGNLMRNAKKDDKHYPFYISLEDIEQSLTEMNGDWEIGSDGKLFFGIEKDYYTSKECWFFDNIQFANMVKTPNPKYSLNQFGLKYKSYQSLKEGEEINSADAVHGESMWSFFNKKVENKKESTIEWVRDPFLLKVQQEKSFEVSDSTATQDDDTLFCVDVVSTQTDQPFTEVTELDHKYSEINSTLTLTNKGEVNFIVLGMEEGVQVNIEAPDKNAGIYVVESVTPTAIVLKIPSIIVAVSPNNDGVRSTKYTYTISKSRIPFTNYTNQGITGIDKLKIGDKFGNLRYSLKRNIENYYQSHLATCNLFWNEKPLTNSVYKNNPDCTFTYDGVTTIEGKEFVPRNPIVSPFMYENMVFANVEHWEFEALQKKIRSDRGFFRTIDNNGRVVKVYPTKMKYSIGSEELTISAEEKFEPIHLTINTNNANFILINNETKIKRIDYDFIDEKLSIYDKSRQRLYNPVYWMNVSINGHSYKSQKELEDLMKLL